MYINDVKVLNDRIEKIQKERTKAEMKKEMLERKLQEEIAKYEKAYNITLNGKNFEATKALIKAEGARVSKAIQEEYSFKLSVVEAIEKGDIATANKLLTEKAEKEKANEEPDEVAVEAVVKKVSPMDIDIESLTGDSKKMPTSEATVKPAKKSLTVKKPSGSEEVIKVKRGIILRKDEDTVEGSVGAPWEAPTKSVNEPTVVKSEGMVFNGNIDDLDIDEDTEPDTISFDDYGDFDIEDDEDIYEEEEEPSERPTPSSTIDIDEDIFSDIDIDNDDSDDSDDFGFGSMLKGTKFGR